MVAVGDLFDGHVSELALDALHAGVSEGQHDVLIEIAQLLFERGQIPAFTGSHREAFSGGKSLNRLREEVFRYHSVCRARIANPAIALLTRGYPCGLPFCTGDMTDLATLRRGRKSFEQRAWAESYRLLQAAES